MTHHDRKWKLPTELLPGLRALVCGQRVMYHGWRGDAGEGVFLRFVDAEGKEVEASCWGTKRRDGLVVKRDFSADAGRLFLPLVGDGDVVEAIGKAAQ